MLEGAYAFVGLTNKKLVGARDPLGIRPLVLGKLDGCPILASETCALDIIGAQYVRDVENGEVVIFDEDGAHSHKPFPPMPARPCIFEYIYFARPDSIIGGRSVYDVRKASGAELAREAPADADVVVPVPDSGVPAAIGYAQESGIPYELGIIRNHYVGRTFIEPTQHIRQLGVRLKHSANRAVVEGKRIVLIDDSIVRGTTSVKIVQMMREAGAREVHFRIASPPITHPDYYGIDTPEQDKLLAATHDLEEHAPIHRRGFARLPFGRRHLPRHGREGAAIRCGRNSPTIASPANIRRRSPTARRRTPRRTSSRCSPKRAERMTQASAGSYRARHRRLARHRPCAVARAGARRRACHRGGAHRRRAGRTRRRGAQAPAARRRWCRSTCATIDGFYRLAAALNERYQRLDVLVGNAAIARPALAARSRRADRPGTKPWPSTSPPIGSSSAPWIRLLRRSDAGRAVFMTSGAATNARAYAGPYSVSKAALNALARTYAAETTSTAVRVNLFNPGPTRTRMRAQVMPGEDPMTLPTPEEVAEKIVRAVPAELHRNRQALRLSAPASSWSFTDPA